MDKIWNQVIQFLPAGHLWPYAWRPFYLLDPSQYLFSFPSKSPFDAGVRFFWKSLPRPTAWPCQLLKALARFTLESLSSHASRACWIKTFRIGQVLEKKTCNSFKTDKTPRTGEFSISPDKLICKLCQQFNRDGKNKKNTFLFGEGSDTACVLFEIHTYIVPVEQYTLRQSDSRAPKVTQEIV